MLFLKKKAFEIDSSISANTFYKGIHLKKEIDVFIYFLNENSISPYILFKNFPTNQNMENYNSFGGILLVSSFIIIIC